MRSLGPPSEIRRLAAPISALLDWVWQRMHWWVIAMVALYALSGITIVKPDEVAVILRWGRLVGETPALQEHGPGLLFAFPRPVDEVVRVPVRHVWEVPVISLSSEGVSSSTFGLTLDPLQQGYALTGDQNIVHVKMVARYRVRNPAEWAFYGPKAEEILRVEITSAMIRTLGEMEVDQVLSNGRKTLITTTTRRAQAGLDASHSGLELSSLELTRLSPPRSLASEFDAVQSAYIGSQTQQNDAQAFSESEIPRAHSDADAAIQNETGIADSNLSNAKGAAQAFLALHQEYQANPSVVRERLYRDTVDRALAKAGNLRWIPPPVGGNYHGFRITLSPSGSQPSGEPSSDTLSPSGSPSSVAPPSEALTPPGRPPSNTISPPRATPLNAISPPSEPQEGGD